MKIAIFTYHRSHNYGAFLQAYSLSHALNKLEDVDCEIINYNLLKEDTVYKKKKWKRPIYLKDFLKQEKMFCNMQKYQLLSGDLLLDDDYEKILDYANEKYDLIIVGSDEIWRIGSRGFPNVYWLPKQSNCKKISYAASGRMNVDNLTAEQQIKMKELYTEFDYIGVRDTATQVMVETLCPEKVVYRNCDPSFLYDEFKDKNILKKYICNKWNIPINKKLIAVMYDRPSVISILRKLLGKEYYFLCVTRPMWNADKNLVFVNVFDWVDILGGVDYLISSYFHGMLFALNQNTPFSVIDRRATRNNLETSKLFDFLSYENMRDRYNMSSEMDEIEWKALANKIECEIQRNSVDFSEILRRERNMYSDFLHSLTEIKTNE